MILDMMAEARRQELALRETEFAHRMHWYDARTVDRLERSLATARARLRISSAQVEARPPSTSKDLLPRPGGGS